MEHDQFAALLGRMRRQGTDDGTCEVKASGRKLSADVWDSVSAFANTSGGTVLLGLEEGSGFGPVAGFDLDKVRDQFVEGIGDGGGEGRLVSPPSYRMERHEVGGVPSS